MMGQLPPDQNALFYDFCLENHVPPDHLLRQVDPFLDLSDLREHLASYYSPIGRPSVDPGGSPFDGHKKARWKGGHEGDISLVIKSVSDLT